MTSNCLQVDIVVAKTFLDKFDAIACHKDELSEAEKREILENLSVSKSDLMLMEQSLKKFRIVFGDMDFNAFMDYYPDVFKKNANGTYSLCLSNMQDEKGNVDLAKFFVGMFIPNFYPPEILQGLGFDENDAYRLSGPWAKYSWSLYATQVRKIPGRSSLDYISNYGRDLQTNFSERVNVDGKGQKVF